MCEAVTRKVHADLLLRLVDSLPDRLLQRVEEGFEGAAGFDLETAREHLHERQRQSTSSSTTTTTCRWWNLQDKPTE